MIRNNQKLLRILWVREQFPWMGRHSGYDIICGAVAKGEPDFGYQSIFRRPEIPLPFGVGKICRILNSKYAISPFYDKFSFYTELQAIGRCLWRRFNLIHLTYVENHLSILPKFTKLLGVKVIGTVHQPQSWWREHCIKPEILKELDALIVLAKKDVDYFQSLRPGKVYYVPHGIDTSFFHPLNCTPPKNQGAINPRFIFVGQWMRDPKTLAGVIERTLYADPSIHFDLVIPPRGTSSNLSTLSHIHQQVVLHTNISDEKLRSLYQKASGLVLPLKDCTANNAILEAAACGMPVISNDVGAIRDYTSDTFAFLFRVGDVTGMVQAVLNLTGNPAARRKRGDAARNHAVRYFDWGKIAAKTIDIYCRLMDRQE